MGPLCPSVRLMYLLGPLLKPPVVAVGSLFRLAAAVGSPGAQDWLGVFATADQQVALFQHGLFSHAGLLFSEALFFSAEGLVKPVLFLPFRWQSLASGILADDWGGVTLTIQTAPSG